MLLELLFIWSLEGGIQKVDIMESTAPVFYSIVEAGIQADDAYFIGFCYLEGDPLKELLYGYNYGFKIFFDIEHAYAGVQYTVFDKGHDEVKIWMQIKGATKLTE